MSDPDAPLPPAPWEELRRSVHADCRVFTVERRRFRHLRRGVEEDFFVICPAHWSVALARDAAGRWLMVRQFRYGTRASGWEFPSGCSDRGEDPIAAAARELREETGYTGHRPHLLGNVQPNPALQDNTCTFVFFEQIERSGAPQWDEHEEMEIALWDDAELRRAALDGRVPHALIHAGLFLYDAWCRQSGRPA